MRAGLHTTVQDEGRWGYQHLGVPVGGALDLAALHRANALVGNPPGEAALEVTLVGLHGARGDGPARRGHRRAFRPACERRADGPGHRAEAVAWRRTGARRAATAAHGPTWRCAVASTCRWSSAAGVRGRCCRGAARCRTARGCPSARESSDPSAWRPVAARQRQSRCCACCPDRMSPGAPDVLAALVRRHVSRHVRRPAAWPTRSRGQPCRSSCPGVRRAARSPVHCKSCRPGCPCC